MIPALAGITGIVSLVCFIMVVVQMFQHDQQGLGIACLVLLLCGIGALIAFIMGWVKAGEWGIQTIMLIWTVCFITSIILNVAFRAQIQGMFG